MDTKKLESTIETAFARKDEINASNVSSDLKQAIQDTIALLETGTIRAAFPTPAGWQTQTWVKQAILLFFKTQMNEVITGEFTQFYDKIPLQFRHFSQSDFNAQNLRIVPPACVRKGAYIGPGTVLMPSYVNIGAYVGEGTMVDTWATVGSCAQIGKHVHISGGVGIGGVLEPLQASPTIIEDHCFIGARSEIVEGVVVERGAVISMGVFIGQSTRIYDRENDEIIYGRVPADSVVVPGSLPSSDGKVHLACAVIVKRVDEKTKQKVGLNQILREVCQ